MRRRIALLGGRAWVVATCACAAPSTDVGSAAQAIAADSGHQLQFLRQQVLRSLRNPGTARFKNEFLNHPANSDQITLCGWVDAEDLSGQRMGPVAFIATADAPVLYQASDPYGGFPHLWRARCSLPADSTRVAEARGRVGDRPAQIAINR